MKITSVFILVMLVFVGCTNSISSQPSKSSNKHINKSKPVSNLPVKIYGIAIGEEFNMVNATEPVSSYLRKYKGYINYSGYIFPKNINKIKGLGSITYKVVPSSKKVASFEFDPPYSSKLDNFEDCRSLKNNLLENLYNKYGGDLSNQINAEYKLVDNQIFISSKGKLVINNVIVAANCGDIVNRKTQKHMAYGGVDIIIPNLVKQYEQEKTSINNNLKKKISKQSYDEMLK